MPLRTVLAATTAFFLVACGGTSRLPEGTAYLPADASVVLSMDLPALASTDLYKELQQRGGAVAMQRLNLMKFAEATGLNPTRDVRWLTIVGRSHGSPGKPVDELAALVSGTFDGARMRRVLKESRMPAETHAGVDIFQMVIVEGRCRFCLAVLDDTTAAFGDGDALRAMAGARSDRNQALARDPAARRLLARVDARAAIWGLARGRDLSAPLAELLGNMRGESANAAPLAAVKDLSFFVIARDPIIVSLDALAANDEDALMVADVLEGAGAVGRLALKQVKPDSADLLSTFKVEVDGSLIRASASVPSARLLDLAGGAAGGLFEGLSGALSSAGETAGTPGSAEPSSPVAPPPEE